ncbi:MAG: hypothetical protein JSV36_10570 [Anaerolineae bacterium]|nr:MAG: hypothetical protein JSV36_10570 [Anaerolineae bacterium]
MNPRCIYALSQDPFWLDAVAQAAATGVQVEPIPCPDGYPDCLQRLPEANPEALLLLDATGQEDVPFLARRLRERGWQHIVVVAADPCSKEARDVLKEQVARDYWTKTYARDAIRRDLRQCLVELWGKDDEQSGYLARG